MLNRIKQYIDFKGVSVSAFEKSIGMSNASFGKSLKNGGTIGADKLEIILNVYPDLNLNWLITGKGEMIKTTPFINIVSEPKSDYNKECQICKAKDQTITTLQLMTKSQEDFIKCLQDQLAKIIKATG